jgi:hypothetical protein
LNARIITIRTSYSSIYRGKIYQIRGEFSNKKIEEYWHPNCFGSYRKERKNRDKILATQGFSENFWTASLSPIVTRITLVLLFFILSLSLQDGGDTPKRLSHSYTLYLMYFAPLSKPSPLLKPAPVAPAPVAKTEKIGTLSKSTEPLSLTRKEGDATLRKSVGYAVANLQLRTPTKKTRVSPRVNFLEGRRTQKKYELSESIHEIMSHTRLSETPRMGPTGSRREAGEPSPEPFLTLTPDENGDSEEGARLLGKLEILKSNTKKAEIFMSLRLPFNPKDERISLKMDVAPLSDKGVGVTIPY